MTKEAEELAQVIEKIDFEGGPSTPEPAPQAAETPAEPVVSTPEGATPPAEPTASTPAPTAEPEVTAPAEEPQPKTETPASEEAPVIPDSHYRAVVHMGLEKELEGWIDKDPALALKFAAKCHEMTNAQSKMLGDLGQKLRKSQESSQVVPVAQPTDTFEKSLREKYADDPIVDLVIEQQKTLRQLQSPAKREEPASRQVDIEEEMAQRQQINQYFAGPEMKVFGDYYGTTGALEDWRNLTPNQIAHRKEVCDQATLIAEGARAAGMTLSAAQALDQAHLLVTAPMAEQFVRQRIAASVTKRAKGVTLKPSGSTTPAPKEGQYSKTKAIAEMGAALKEVFKT